MQSSLAVDSLLAIGCRLDNFSDLPISRNLLLSYGDIAVLVKF
jgi:hypothetical protein